MYAVIEIKGKQFRVSEGDTISLPRCATEAGKKLTPDRVLLIGGEEVKVGTPEVKGAKVDLLVVEHTRGPKIRGFKYKAKINYKRAWGHRAELTVVRVEKIKA